MLEIINQKGQILQLSDSVNIAVERNNMLFNKSDTLFQDVTYSSSAPLTPSNKIFIANAHLVDSNIDLYQINVSVYLGSEMFFAGKMFFSIKKNEIDFNIKSNFAEAAKIASDANLNEIDVNDQFDNLPPANMAGLMTDTVNNPQNHNYIFVPQKNVRLQEGLPTTTTYYGINPWGSFGFNSFFVPEPGSGAVFTLQVPFPQVLATLKIIGKILGFTKITGNWQNTQQGLTTYIFNLKSCSTVANSSYSTYPFGQMLPNLTIADFLKQTRQRLRLSFDFNSQTKEFKIESFESALKVDPIDLTNYVEELTEINAPLQKGYKINLAVDEQDEDWNSGTDEESVFIPQYDLLIGDQKEEIKIPVGTLRSEKNAERSIIKSQLIAVGGDDYNSINNIGLRFFKFDGLINRGGFIAPESSSLDLTIDDAKFYNFLNYALEYRLLASIPVSVLNKITSTSIITFVTKSGQQVKALIVKVSYDLKTTKQYVKTDIICKSLNYQLKAQPILRDNYAVLGEGDFILTYYKSNFQDLAPEITATIDGGVIINLTSSPNKVPCDKFGVGGQSQPCYPPLGTTATFFSNVSFRITQGRPQQLRYQAMRANFVLQLDGSYIANLPFAFTPINGLAFFIVF